MRKEDAFGYIIVGIILLFTVKITKLFDVIVMLFMFLFGGDVLSY